MLSQEPLRMVFFYMILRDGMNISVNVYLLCLLSFENI